jgi:HlyD family secretion protein
MKVTRRRIFYLIIIIVIGLLAFRVASRVYQEKQQEDNDTAQVQQERVVPVQVAKVQRGNIRSFLTVSGLVEPKETVRVYAKTVGQAKELLVQEGDDVKKDDILVRMDDEQIRLQVAQAKATLDSAQASLEKVQAGARPQEISQAEAAMRQAKINLDSAEENYLRMEKLFSEGAVSEQQYEQAKGQYEIAEAQYQSANESYKLVIEGASQPDIRAVEAQVRQAQSALEIAQSQLNNSIVKAPINGKVISISVKTGELVASAVPLLSILDVSELYIKAGISEKDIASIQIGQEAEILIDAYPQEKFYGEVTSRGVMVDPTSKSMEIKIKIIEPHVDIPPGVFARANIVIENKANALIIPSTALTRKTDGLYVFVLNNDRNRIERRAIVTGMIQDNQVELVEGLQENEVVVILGNIDLEEGDQVRVTNREVTE